MPTARELDARLRALRLSVREIADDTRLDEHTVARALGRPGRGREVLTSTQRKVADAIERHERAQLARLKELLGEAKAADAEAAE